MQYIAIQNLRIPSKLTVQAVTCTQCRFGILDIHGWYYCKYYTIKVVIIIKFVRNKDVFLLTRSLLFFAALESVIESLPPRSFSFAACDAYAHTSSRNNPHSPQFVGLGFDAECILLI